MSPYESFLPADTTFDPCEGASPPEASDTYAAQPPAPDTTEALEEGISIQEVLEEEVLSATETQEPPTTASARIAEVAVEHAAASIPVLAATEGPSDDEQLPEDQQPGASVAPPESSDRPETQAGGEGGGEGEPPNAGLEGEEGDEEDEAKIDRRIREVLERHQAYAMQIITIDSALLNGVDPAAFEDYVGQTPTQLQFETEDGNILKIPYASESGSSSAEGGSQDPTAYIEAVIAGSEVDGLAQMVDFVEPQGEDGLGGVIIEKTWDTTLEELSQDPEAAQRIPLEHYGKLLETVDAMTTRGLIVGPGEGVIGYSSDKGFVITDYLHGDAGNQPPERNALAILTPLFQAQEWPNGALPQTAWRFVEACQERTGDNEHVMGRVRDGLIGIREGIEDMEQTQRYIAQMNAIDDALTKGISPENIPGFVRQRREALVFNTEGGKQMELYRNTRLTSTQLEFSGLWLVKGVDGLQEDVKQVIKYVSDPTSDGLRDALIVEPVIGEPFEEMTPEQRRFIPIEHFSDLVRAYAAMAGEKLWPEGLDYDIGRGFTILSAARTGVRLTIDEVTGRFLHPIGTAAIGDRWEEGQPFPYEGEAYLKAYEDSFGPDRTRAFVRRLRDWYGRADIPDIE
ncbi:MAG TPA: hypothetical protein VLF60_02985 [Candidatus Saccharimonadales bacterium]|nr:hypothetical protein [Candidatus Saccharimonadales bacterium]